MTEVKNYLFCYIDELDNSELINFRDELINDIEFLKIIRDYGPLEFEFKRLQYVSDVIKKRNLDEKTLKLSM